MVTHTHTMSKKWHICAMSRLHILSRSDTRTHAQDVGCCEMPFDKGDNKNCVSSIEYPVCTVHTSRISWIRVISTEGWLSWYLIETKNLTPSHGNEPGRWWGSGEDSQGKEWGRRSLGLQRLECTILISYQNLHDITSENVIIMNQIHIV